MIRAALLAGGLAACKKATPAPVFEKVPVERRDIIVAASAAGAIQPILTIDVKSQASGAITAMRVQTGDDVKPGQILALIDPRLPRSALDQAEASLAVARAQLQTATTQMAREDTLLKALVVTQQEWETTKVSFAQAQAAVVTAQSNLSDARIAYDQTRVTAPLTGTIIQKNVDLGTVISSPTRDVSGGTILFKMANLDTVQVQGLVDETDIGKIQPGMPVTITVDAFANRPFDGTVLKIEPQATVTQNVTQFPVLVNIANPGHLLKPGMNTEVEVHVGQRQGVLAVPNAALRTQTDVASAADVLGLDQKVVQQQLAQQAAPRGDSGSATMGGGGAKTDPAPPAAGAASNTLTLPNGMTVKLPPGVTAQEVQAAMQKRFSGGQLSNAEQAMLRQVFSQFRGQGGGPGGGQRRNTNESGGRYIVFVMRNGQPTPVNVRTGLTDLDYSEVVSGLTEKDTVLVLPSASLVNAQKQFQQRVQSFTGGGIPGMRQQTQQAPSQTARPATPR
ncbi:MAG TPA: efflux RND transporter periplasmic adaptor subunit [Gemmatimonadales bacterium]|nr:efflux RND transporter periplasmic adaptor subunit [Gemmatimonadales bacterium]